MKYALLCFSLFISFPVFAQDNFSAIVSKPEEAGISFLALSRVDSLMQKYVSENKLPGMVTMLARKGKVVSFQKYGNMEEGKPMQKEAIFRIASMTKPVTSVALMILYDEGRLQLDDPVSKYIPEFKDLQVFSSDDAHGLHLEKQINPMTIRNLLTHTSGLCSGAEDSYVDSLYRTAKLNEGSLQDEIQKLARLPLAFQPGTRWQYGLSTDVLGYIIEKISGKPLNVFFKERIFIPLKMTDTDYSVPLGKLDRVPAVYSPGDKGIQVLNVPEVHNITEPFKSVRGNGGLLSTATDYMSFCQMLLNKGEYKGSRILKTETVELMTSNQLTHELMPDDDFLGRVMSGMGFGLGFAVFKEADQTNSKGSAGSYWWSGSANTYFFIDPKEDLIFIFMTQFVPNYYYPVCKEFRELVYQAIIR
jgi:CubicO group peptidase (beta-lactamase class C family)